MPLLKLPTQVLYLIAVLLGLGTGYLHNDLLFIIAGFISALFINLLKLVSIPIIFCSIVSTISGMQTLQELRQVGGRVLKYTVFTTLLAASTGLALFLLLEPAQVSFGIEKLGPTLTAPLSPQSKMYLDHIIQIVPSNIIQPFSEGNVIGVLLLALLLGFAIISLEKPKQALLHDVFSGLYAAVMKITGFIIKPMPLAIWAFVTLFVRELQEGLEVKSLALYLVCVVAANLIQAFIILPLILKSKGLSPIILFKGMLPALNLAFWSKSSAAALPIAIQCATDRVKISPKIANLSLPLCTTINMNACAAFILITVLFVSSIHGATFSGLELVGWIFVATLAAIGNAGVPMGCYFLSTALLASQNVPLYILGIILPFYSLIDMLESAINVWSDSCVTYLVERDTQDKLPLKTETKV